jgi:putative membrane protein
MRSEPADSPARDGTNRAQPPVPGANSFTEGQARSRIESHGYQQIGELRKDDQSIWHARAQKNGKPVEVQLDFKGNVVEK